MLYNKDFIRILKRSKIPAALNKLTNQSNLITELINKKHNRDL